MAVENGDINNILTQRDTQWVNAEHPQERTLELGLLDLVYAEKFVCYTLFFPYDIQGENLRQGLSKWCDAYFEFVARIEHHPVLKYSLKVEVTGALQMIEQHCLISAHETVHRYGCMLSEVDRIPSYVRLPVYLESIRLADMLDGTEPLMKVKLTHYSDGHCSIGFTCANIIAGHQQILNAIADLGSILRGVTPIERDHNHSYFWPDRAIEDEGLQKLFPPTSFPRKFNLAHQMDCFQAEQSTEKIVSVEMLYFPEAVLQAICETLQAFLDTDAGITHQHVLTALLWLLRCEIEADQRDIGALLRTRKCLMMMDVQDNNTATSNNYFCNSVCPIFVDYREQHEAPGRSHLWKYLLNATLLVRNGFKKVHNAMEVAQGLIGVYRGVNNTAMMEHFLVQITCGSWTMTSKIRSEEFDFGHGIPEFVHFVPPLPFFRFNTFSHPSVERSGFFATVFVFPSQRKAFFESQFLNQCAHGTQYVFGNSQLSTQRMNLW